MGAREVRESVAALLDPVAGLRVVPYADEVAPEPKSAVAVVFVNQIGPVDVMPSAALLYKVKVVLAVAKTDPGTSDDALDDLLAAVLAVLDAADQLLWTLAERTTYLGGTSPDGLIIPGHPAYSIDLEVRA